MMCQLSPIRSVVLLLALATAATCSTHLQNTGRSIHRDDILGFYSLHPDSYLISNETCPLSLSQYSFQFAVNPAPSLVDAPSKFNIIIPHTTSQANGQACTDGTSIIAVTSDHPFVASKLSSVRSWAGAGNEDTNLPWLAGYYETFVPSVASSDFIIGYDFNERVCNGTRISSHAAYLWMQPTTPLSLRDVQLTPNNKYLFLAFGGRKKHSACVYVAQRVGGQDPFNSGPTSDTANNKTNNHPTRPQPSYKSSVPLPSGISAPGLESPTASVSPTQTPTPSSPLVIPTPFVTDAFVTNSPVFDVIENDPDGPFGNASENSQRSACFPGDGIVLLESGKVIYMDQLSHGHSIKVGRAQFSGVYFFSHRIPENKYPFLKISFVPTQQQASTWPSSITISENHYMYVSTSWTAMPPRQQQQLQMITAGEVRERMHYLMLQDGTKAMVTDVERVWRTGLYAPHTMHGDIVVNNVVVSTYTKAVHPLVAHWLLLSPVRIVYRLGFVNVVQGWFNNGAAIIVSLQSLASFFF